MQPLPNIFSVDVEDYFHVNAFKHVIRDDEWGSYPGRVVPNTHRILGLLNRYQVPAVFFVLGWVADRYPGLVRDIQKSGHEIGSHSFRHRLVYTLTPEEFREDLLNSCKVIEEIIGETVKSYRAPSFSVTKNSLWALDILAEEGIKLDSSIYPIRHDVYGIPDAEQMPHTLDTAAGHIHEFPGTVCRRFGMNVPVGGGGYFRQFTWNWTRTCLRRTNDAGRPFMFYIHPWEVDPDQPRVSRIGLKSRLRHYRNLHTTEPKLERLLKEFRFGRLSDVVTTLEERCQVSGGGCQEQGARSKEKTDGKRRQEIAAPPSS
ncbi:MAG: DUF3473 domain-containing protein [Planctomycetaceae bacterium]|nr:DUF3473 domain-containing protein [Planctomycetaceae bacterium]